MSPEALESCMTWLTLTLPSPTAIDLSRLLLATTPDAGSNALVLAGVLLSLIVIFLASKVGGELCVRLDLPPVLGELVAGVLVGVSALHLLIFPEAGEDGTHSLIMSLMQMTSHLSPEAFTSVFQAQSEVIAILSELG